MPKRIISGPSKANFLADACVGLTTNFSGDRLVGFEVLSEILDTDQQLGFQG
jgi:hypothetical protein